MKICPICQKRRIYSNRDFCNACYKEHCPDGVIPKWAKAMKDNNNHFNYVERQARVLETQFSDLSQVEKTELLGEN